MIFHLLQVITALWNSSFFAYFSDFWFIIDGKCYEFVRNGIVHRTLTFLCIYHQKKASKLRISMLSLNAFFLIILLLFLKAQPLKLSSMEIPVSSYKKSEYYTRILFWSCLNILYLLSNLMSKSILGLNKRCSRRV